MAGGAPGHSASAPAHAPWSVSFVMLPMILPFPPLAAHRPPGGPLCVCLFRCLRPGFR
jgi:hypothetical protein